MLRERATSEGLDSTESTGGLSARAGKLTRTHSPEEVLREFSGASASIDNAGAPQRMEDWQPDSLLGAMGLDTDDSASFEGKERRGGGTERSNRSARFEGDSNLESVRGGTDTVHRGERGLSVTKLQQALVDLGYLLPRFGVDGIFEGETRAAVVAFQRDSGITPPSGRLDQRTINALHARYDTRAPYIAAGAHDPANPGTRALSAGDRTAAHAAMAPPRGVGGAPATFSDVIPTNSDSYGTRIRARLSSLITSLHTDLYATKAPLRANAANLDSWSTLEGAASAAKDATDGVYASNYGGAAAVPAMTHAGGNLMDQWEDEEAVQSAMTPAQLQQRAEDLVTYLVDANCEDINQEHGAVPSDAAEQAILQPIVRDLTDTPAEVQTLNQIDIGWEGTQLSGQVFLQRYRSQNADPAAAKEENRVRMWGLFHTCIHEYLHLLAHVDYQNWANTLDDTRRHTMLEGFCDFFTLNVRAALAPTPAMISSIEGPYANGNPIPPVNSGVYPSHAQAEQVVSIVGVRNAQAAYFRGDVAAVGGP